MNKIVVINVGGGGGAEEKDYPEVDRDFAIECMIYQYSTLTSVECSIIPHRKVKWLKPPQRLPVLHPPFLILIIMEVVDEDDDQELVLLLHICLSRSRRIRSSKGCLERDHYTYTSEHTHSHLMHYQNSPSGCSRNGYSSLTAASCDPNSETTTRTSSASPNFTMSLSPRTPLMPPLMDFEVGAEKNNDGDDHVYKGVDGIDEDEDERYRSE